MSNLDTNINSGLGAQKQQQQRQDTPKENSTATTDKNKGTLRKTSSGLASTPQPAAVQENSSANTMAKLNNNVNEIRQTLNMGTESGLRQREISPPMPGMTRRRDKAKSMKPPQEVGAGPFRFRLYQLLYPVFGPLFVYLIYDISSGRKIDISDSQWHTFRSGLFSFFLAMLSFVVLNWIYKNYVLLRLFPRNTNNGFQLTRGFFAQFYFIAAFSVVFLFVITGASIIFIAIFTGINYILAKAFAGKSYGPVIWWVFTMGMLFCNEEFGGYSFASISSSLEWLDHHRGLIRWHVTYNITMLRMISFDMDYHWRIKQEEIRDSDFLDETAEASPKTDKDRIEISAMRDDYSFCNYWAYLYYPPLYLAGPIISFNDFISQARHGTQSSSKTPITPKSTLIYGTRLLFAIFVMELMLHMIHPVAMSTKGVWNDYSMLEIMTIGYIYLTFIWLKLCIIWRFSRFWAMADGVETIENMRRCMSNNYSLQLFWRDWHCSYNRWLVRYIYIPVGGSKTQPWNLFLIFTFVALWHDISSRLLMWAWLIAFLFVPEGAARYIFDRPKWRKWRWFRLLCAFGGGVNIFGMMAANLVGFAVGVDGIKEMSSQILSWTGILTLLLILVVFVIHTLTMFDVRGAEYYKEYMSNQTKLSPPLQPSIHMRTLSTSQTHPDLDSGHPDDNNSQQNANQQVNGVLSGNTSNNN
ncbi:glycerol transporter [Mycoemilia scoparia]|uniref:Glycerol transporter n=1 Tax=Mycoemilia scoparia TaxID=417184 RepID=A0A9W8DRR2_9FUNG|nr:glycerol transporter [Mycoemilia scoparia]